MTEQSFPALRCKIGDWVYYVAAMTFADIDTWVRPVADIHKKKRLRDWIQRVLEKGRPKEIADYLRMQEQRFFNAIVVGVYHGDPAWYSMKVAPTRRIEGPSITPADARRLEGEIGFLHFTGSEQLFAIDGQHRVAGIKEVLKHRKKLRSEEVAVIFVAHSGDRDGLVRTRRLFTTLNKTARRVAPRDIIALDEDNGFAIVTRRLIDEFRLLGRGKIVALKERAELRPSDRESLTTIEALYHITRDLYPLRKGPAKGKIAKTRPDDSVLDAIYEDQTRYWTALANKVPQYRRVLRTRNALPGSFRSHVLFRPIGQRAFARATRYLVSRGNELDASVDRLLANDLRLRSEAWHYLLWDPINKRMMKPQQLQLATSYLLHCVGTELPKKQRKDLNEFLNNRGTGA